MPHLSGRFDTPAAIAASVTSCALHSVGFFSNVDSLVSNAFSGLAEEQLLHLFCLHTPFFLQLNSDSGKSLPQTLQII